MRRQEPCFTSNISVPVLLLRRSFLHPLLLSARTPILNSCRCSYMVMRTTTLYDPLWTSIPPEQGQTYRFSDPQVHELKSWHMVCVRLGSITRLISSNRARVLSQLGMVRRCGEKGMFPNDPRWLENIISIFKGTIRYVLAKIVQRSLFKSVWSRLWAKTIVSEVTVQLGILLRFLASAWPSSWSVSSFRSWTAFFAQHF
jgi:hypothetical protein